MITVDHLLSDGRGSQPVTVTVCRTCADFNRLRSADRARRLLTAAGDVERGEWT